MTSGIHPAEPHIGALNNKLNWLRAGVLGANDGIVSVAGIVVGVPPRRWTTTRSSRPGSPV